VSGRRSGVTRGNLVRHRVVRIGDRRNSTAWFRYPAATPESLTATPGVRSDRAAGRAGEVILQVRLVGREPAQQGVPMGYPAAPAGFEGTRVSGHHELPSAIDAVTPKA
jgi:hypothetical protein